MKNVKNILLLAILALSVGVIGCSNEQPQPKKKAVKKETTAKKKQPQKTASSMQKFWPAAKRKFKLNDAQVKSLKNFKTEFDNGKKRAGNDKAVKEKLRNEYYGKIKSLLGKEKGQQYINYSRRFKRKMAEDKKK